MADDTRPGEDADGQDAPDLGAVRRRRAQGTAADLARMGIDPRSLGLSDAQEQPHREPVAPQPAPPEDDPGSAPVVHLRPELSDPRRQQAVPGPAPVPAPAPTARAAPPDERGGPASVERPPSAVEQLLARTATAMRPPRQTRRLLSAVTRGMVTADAAESVLDDRELVEAVRHRQSDRRVVAFVAGKGGVGCTTTAVGTGTCFTALREDRSAVVDVQQGAVPLSATFGADRGLDLAALARLDTDSPVPAAPSGLGLVDGSPWDLPASRRDLAGTLERLGTDHTFALLDAGTSPSEVAHAAVARADQVVLVTGSGGLGAGALETALDRVRDVNPAAAAQAVHVVVCQHEETYRTVHRTVISRLGRDPVALVVVPPDPYLAQGHPYAPDLVSASTREAFLRVAAAVALGASR